MYLFALLGFLFRILHQFTVNLFFISSANANANKINNEKHINRMFAFKCVTWFFKFVFFGFKSLLFLVYFWIFIFIF